MGSGSLVLAGNNTYLGILNIVAGTLQIGAGGVTGSLAADIANGGLVSFNRADASVYAGVIGGLGSFEKRGPGELTLSGTHTFSGSVSVLEGT
jgi:autotransporter-associated beta strand protein